MQDTDFHRVCRPYRPNTMTQDPRQHNGTHDGCQWPSCLPHLLPCDTYSFTSSHVFASLADGCSLRTSLHFAETCFYLGVHPGDYHLQPRPGPQVGKDKWPAATHAHGIA